jgi:hypothetical protein
MSNSINRIVSTEEQIFDSVKDAFINKMNYIAEKTGQYYPSLTTLTNLCCSEEEKEILLDLAIKIKENEDSIFGTTNVSFKDICYGVIYTYYGLNLTEELSYFNISVLPRNENKEIVFENMERWTVNKEFNYWINTHTDNISMVYYLYVRLGMPSLSQQQFGDIITKDGENLSEKLRKFVITSQTTTSSASPIKPVKTSTRPISKRGGKKSKRTTKKPVKRTKRKSKRNKRRHK